MHQTPKGVPVPDPGDDLLDAYEKGFAAAGIVVRFPSVAAFRAALAAAQAAGAPPTSAHPWYGSVGPTMYVADGTTKNNAYVLTAVGTPQTWEASAAPSVSGTQTVAAGRWVELVRVPIEAAPYDRKMLVIGTAWCQVTSGTMDVEVYHDIHGTTPIGRARVNSADDGNTGVSAFFHLKAGQSVTVGMYLKSVHAPSSSTVKTSGDGWTRVQVMGWPADMGGE